MLQQVGVRLATLMAVTVAIVVMWPPSDRVDGPGQAIDGDGGAQPEGGGSEGDQGTTQEAGGGETDPDLDAGAASGSEVGAGGADGSAQSFTNGAGTYFSTLGAPDQVLRWMSSSQILFNQPLPPDTPAQPNSAEVAANIDQIIRGELLYSYASGIEEDRNAPYVVLVDSDREAFTEVVFRPQDCGADTWWGWGNDEFSPYVNGVYEGRRGIPLPDGFEVDPDDSDFHVVVYDWRHDILIELWRAKPTVLTGRPGIEVCWGGVIKDYAASGTGVFPFPVGVTAAGLSSLGLTITLEDLRRGEINHAIGVSSEIAIDNRTGADRSYPATRNDGRCTSLDPAPDPYQAHVAESVGGVENCLYQGQYLRLPADYDVESIPHPYARMIATAARDYGLVLQDIAGCFCFQAESGRSVTANMEGADDPWAAFYDGTPEWEILAQIDWTQLQVLPPDWNQPDGFQIQCVVPPNRTAADNPMAGDSRCQVPVAPYGSG